MFNPTGSIQKQDLRNLPSIDEKLSKIIKLLEKLIEMKLGENNE